MPNLPAIEALVRVDAKGTEPHEWVTGSAAAHAEQNDWVRAGLINQCWRWLVWGGEGGSQPNAVVRNREVGLVPAAS